MRETIKRPFRKLKGVSKANDDYALKHNRRTYIFSMTTEDGSSIESQGNVKPEHCKRLADLLVEIHKLSDE